MLFPARVDRRSGCSLLFHVLIYTIPRCLQGRSPLLFRTLHARHRTVVRSRARGHFCATLCLFEFCDDGRKISRETVSRTSGERATPAPAASTHDCKGPKRWRSRMPTTLPPLLHRPSLPTAACSSPRSAPTTPSSSSARSPRVRRSTFVPIMLTTCRCTVQAAACKYRLAAAERSHAT